MGYFLCFYLRPRGYIVRITSKGPIKMSEGAAETFRVLSSASFPLFFDSATYDCDKVIEGIYYSNLHVLITAC